MKYSLTVARLLAVVLAGTILAVNSCASADVSPPATTRPAEVVRVVVWDEQQLEQKPAYENFLGNAIADHLKMRRAFP